MKKNRDLRHITKQAKKKKDKERRNVQKWDKKLRNERREQAKKDARGVWKNIREKMELAASRGETTHTEFLTDRCNVSGRDYLEELVEGIRRRCKRGKIKLEAGPIRAEGSTEFVGSMNPEPVGWNFGFYAVTLEFHWN